MNIWILVLVLFIIKLITIIVDSKLNKMVSLFYKLVVAIVGLGLLPLFWFMYNTVAITYASMQPLWQTIYPSIIIGILMIINNSDINKTIKK